MFCFLKLYFNKKYLYKISWCLQHFLTMEFYRKICNKCYWSNYYNESCSVFSRCLILFISFVSMLFFSFFYLPTDPANSVKSSVLLRVKDFIKDFRLNLEIVLNLITNTIISFTSSIVQNRQAIPIRAEILNRKSSLLI